MKPHAGILRVCLGSLLFAGCSNSPGTGGGRPSETERKAAEEAARAQRFEDLLENGKKAQEAKRLEEAIKLFEEAVRLQDDPQARELLEQAQKVREEVRKAAYDKAMLRGGQLSKEKNYRAAVAAFRDALRHLPDDKEAAAALYQAEFHDFREKGRTALENEQYADAVQMLGEAAKRQPEDNDSRELLKQARVQRRLQVMTQGQAALDAKQYREAVRLFTEAQDLLPDAKVTALRAEASFQAKLQLGRQRVEDNQFAAAIPDLEEAARLKPDHRETRDLLRKAIEGKKQQDKVDYDRALAVGDAALQRKDYQTAINSYREALAKQPLDGIASSKLTQAQNAKAKKEYYDRHVSQGKTQLSFKNYFAAEAEFRAALLDVPDDPEARRLLRQAQNAKAKKESYERHMSQGKTQLSLKNYRLAEIEFQAALSDIPTDLEAQRLLQQARQGKR